MSPRPLASAALVLSAVCASVPLLAGPASAVVPESTDNTLVVSDTNGDFGDGLFRTPAGGSRTAVVPENPDLDISGLSASRDGGRFAYAQDLYASSGTSDTASIVVRDAGGALVRVVDPITTTDATADMNVDLNPALSPDGSELVYTRLHVTDTALTVAVRRVNLSTGATTTIPGASDSLAWAYLDPTTLISIGGATGSSPSLVTMPVTGGTQTPVSGMDPNLDGEFAVSPDGTRIAWTHITSDPSSTSTPQTADIRVGDLSVSSGTATVSNAATLATGLDNNSASWSTDGATISFIHDDGNGGDGDLWSVNSTGTPVVNEVSTPGEDELYVAHVATDTTAPAATVTPKPFTLAGTSARIAWTLEGADADLSGVRITRTGGAASKTVLVPGSATAFTDTGLVVGTTYTYAISAVDHSGNAGAPGTRQLTAIKPFATVPDPTSTSYYTSPAFRVSLPTVGTYQVQVRTNGTGALTTWIPASSSTTNHGASHVYTAARAGYSYGFLVTSYDAFGNSSAATAGGTAVVPYDQTKASFSGSFLTQSLSGRYLGSATLLRTAGSAARITVNGNRLQIVGERCASCGVMDVYVDGVRVAGIDTRASARQARQVLYTRSLAAGVNHAIVVKARGTAGRPNVVLDGFGVRH